jgi:hypothetical protein
MLLSFLFMQSGISFWSLATDNGFSPATILPFLITWDAAVFRRVIVGL